MSPTEVNRRALAFYRCVGLEFRARKWRMVRGPGEDGDVLIDLPECRNEGQLRTSDAAPVG